MVREVSNAAERGGKKIRWIRQHGSGRWQWQVAVA